MIENRGPHKKDVLVIFTLLQETKNSNLFDKNYANVSSYISTFTDLVGPGVYINLVNPS